MSSASAPQIDRLCGAAQSLEAWSNNHLRLSRSKTVTFVFGASSKRLNNSLSSRTCEWCLETSLSNLNLLTRCRSFTTTQALIGVVQAANTTFTSHWKLDLQQYPTVYQNLAEKLGPNHPMATLMQKELTKDVEEPASKRPRTATANFWQATAKSFQKALCEVVQHAEQLTDEEPAAAFQGDASTAAASPHSLNAWASFDEKALFFTDFCFVPKLCSKFNRA